MKSWIGMLGTFRILNAGVEKRVVLKSSALLAVTTPAGRLGSAARDGRQNLCPAGRNSRRGAIRYRGARKP